MDQMNTQKGEKNESHHLPPSIDKELQGAKLLIGDQLVDPFDRRVRLPHSRMASSFAGTSHNSPSDCHSSEQTRDASSGGLLQNTGHRPVANSANPTVKTDASETKETS